MEQPENAPATRRDPYTSLLTTLMPGSEGFGIWGAQGFQRWIQSDNQMTGLTEQWRKEFASLVARSESGNKALMAGVSDGHVAYAFPLGDGGKVRLGTLVVVAAGPSVGREPRSAQMVLQLLKPALHCISRDMLIQGALAKTKGEMARQGAELAFMRDLEDIFNPAEGVNRGLRRVLDRALDILGAGSLVLTMPGLGLRCQRIRQGAARVPDGKVVRHLEKNLMAWLALNRRSLCLPDPEQEGAVGPDLDPGFPLMACGLHGEREHEGMLLALGQPESVLCKHRSTLEALARKVSALVLSQADAETGAFHRAAFEGELDQLPRAGKEHSVLFLHLERLSRVRSDFGRKAGEEVLKHFCGLLRGMRREGQMLGRLGDSRFALLLPETPVEEAMKTARALSNAISSMHYLDGAQGLRMGVSIGVAGSDSAGSAAAALACAEAASEEARAQGGNRAQAFKGARLGEGMDSGDLALANYLGTALEKGGFKLVAQGAHRNPDRQPSGYFEVLLRLEDASGADLCPEQFFPVARRYDLMPSIDRWALDELIEHLAAAGPAPESHQRVGALNLSAETLADGGFLQFLADRLAAHGVAGAQLCLEIAESDLVAERETVSEFIGKARQLGCQITLDRFGSGLSSLTSLDGLDVDYVKIDGERVMGMGDSRAAQALVAAIGEAVSRLGWVSIANCVESDACLEMVRDMRVDLLQGFGLAQWQPLEDFLAGKKARPASAGKSRKRA